MQNGRQKNSQAVKKIKIQLGSEARGQKERKLNDHVYSFLLFVSSKPRYQAEF